MVTSLRLLVGFLLQLLYCSGFQLFQHQQFLKKPSFLMSSSSDAQKIQTSTSSSANTIKAGDMTLTIPAQSFLESVNQAAYCTRQGLKDGYKLLEVEFPPLELEALESTASSSEDISRSNTRWAIEFSRLLAKFYRISIVYPDKTELKQALAALPEPNNPKPYKNITLASVRADSLEQAGSLDQFFTAIFRSSSEKSIVATPDTDLYVAILSSTQELPDLERLHQIDPNIPIVFFNLGLDTLVSLSSLSLHYLL